LGFPWKLARMGLNGVGIKYLESFGKVYGFNQLIDIFIPEVV